MISDIKHIFKSIFAFRFRELRSNRLFKIGIVGTIGFIIQAAFFEIFGLQLQVFRPAIAAVLGTELSIISGFILNNLFSFSDRKFPFNRNIFKKFFQFNLAVAVSLVIQGIVVFIGEAIAPENFMLLRGFNILGVLIGLIFNYNVYTRVVWRRPVDV